MPKRTRKIIQEEMDAWASWGVEGHLKANPAWLSYHENITGSFARLVGAKEKEVVAMNTLTVNLHLMMVSFYRPSSSRYKILIENNTFPSDKYAADSQARFHGFDPEDAVVELRPKPGKLCVEAQDVLDQIDELGDSLALVLLGNCNYLSGQCFDFQSITRAGHKNGAYVGFNLAHGAGNLKLALHDWNVDFAVWCTYKYLNSGPGGIAGAFVHSQHLGQKEIPRFEGWWGTNKERRFKMRPEFEPIPTVEAWQLSNPPIFQLAALRSSMEIFDDVGMTAIREKGDQLTSYLEWLLQENCADAIDIVTPAYSEETQTRGSMLSIKAKKNPVELNQKLIESGVVLDFREPNILRISAAPLYNSYEDVFKLVDIMRRFCHD